jgi:hypothetical protein
MFRKASYKTKNRLLLAGVILLIVVAYNAAFKESIALYNETAGLEIQLQTANDAPVKIALLKKENERMDMLLGKENNSAELQQSLLIFITNYCKENNLILEDFPKPLLNSDKGMLVETNTFIVQGGFNKLLQLDYLFEQKLKIGKVASVHYHANRNYDTKKSNLTVTLYIQNIKRNSHET